VPNRLVGYVIDLLILSIIALVASLNQRRIFALWLFQPCAL